MGCKAVNGILNVCGDLVFPGGADPFFYVGYLSDLGTQFSLTQTGDISSIQFQAYKGLVKFEGPKFSHNFTWETGQGPGKNIYFIHKAAVKLMALSTADDVEVQRLAQASDAFIIFRSNADEFKIMGAGRGLSVEPGALGGTGQQASDDVSDTLTLSGAEKTKPLRFFSSSVSATLTLLDGYVR